MLVEILNLLYIDNIKHTQTRTPPLESWIEPTHRSKHGSEQRSQSPSSGDLEGPRHKRHLWVPAIYSETTVSRPVSHQGLERSSSRSAHGTAGVRASVRTSVRVISKWSGVFGPRARQEATSVWTCEVNPKARNFKVRVDDSGRTEGEVSRKG